MELNFFLKGLLLGFSIAAPVGPIALLCIRRTLQFGRLSGFFSGLGAATADGIYGGIAAFGLNLLSDFLIAGRVWLHLVGGLFLIYLGGRTFFAKQSDITKGLVSHKTLLADFFSTFFLTFTNPLTIFSFFALFAALGLAEQREVYWNAILLVSGIFFGSATWWLILSEGITLFRKKITPIMMVWVNRSAGLVIGFVGALTLLSLCL
jgi:threonine/homoserine/homoserine lactone efflux protein